MQDIAPYLLIIFSAFGGFLIAFYIRHKKSSREVLVCPLNSNCEEVIHSDYSRFFGIPVEILGLLYYGVIAVSYGFIIGLPEYVSPNLLYILFALSGGAFLFSLYLTFIQAFTLREWCTWCLTSAALSTIIFISSMVGSIQGVDIFLKNQREILIGVHVLAMAIGIGIATLTDILFFRFLKDFKISIFESDVLKILSEIIWFALAFILFTGLGLFFSDTATYLHSAKFLAKIVIVGVIIGNGAILNLYITPRFLMMFTDNKDLFESPRSTGLRRIAFALGAVSLVSWYSAFILGSMGSSRASFPVLLAGYGIILCGSLLVSQVLEMRFTRMREQSF